MGWLLKCDQLLPSLTRKAIRQLGFDVESHHRVSDETLKMRATKAIKAAFIDDFFSQHLVRHAMDKANGAAWYP